MKESLTLALEVLYGCQFSCYGCLANKEIKQIPTDQEFDTLIEFVDTLGKDLILHDLEITPTDFLTSTNTKELIKNRKLKELASYFNALEISSTLLYPKKEDYDVLCDYVYVLNESGNLVINTPFDLKHLQNEKYLTTLKENSLRVKESLGKDSRLEFSFFVVFDQLLSFSHSLDIERFYDLYQTFINLEIYPDSTYHFNLVNERRFLLDPFKRKEVKTIIQRLNKLFRLDLERQENVTTDNVKYNELNPLVKPHTCYGYEFYWDSGKLYHVPAIYQNVEVVHPLLEIGSIEPQEALSAIDEMIRLSLDAASQISDCSECELLFDCAKKYTPVLVNALELNQCMYT